jgi:hypothetical protein
MQVSIAPAPAARTTQNENIFPCGQGTKSILSRLKCDKKLISVPHQLLISNIRTLGLAFGALALGA